MKKYNFIKKISLGLAAFGMVVLGFQSVSAAQIDYNNPNNKPVETPRFNIYTNAPAGIGNEADFVRMRKSNGDPTVAAVDSNYTDPLNDACEVGSMFDIRTIIHNGANTEYNDNGKGSGVAKDVSVKIQAPIGKTSSKFVFNSTVNASNASSVTDTGTLNCANNVQLKLVPSTVKVYSKHTGWNNGADSAVNGSMRIGSREAGSGDVWGCWDDRVMIVYTVQVVEAPKPAPEVQCDAIIVEKLGKRRYRYGVKYSATNGAALKNVEYKFGDGNSQSVKKPFTAEHEYAKGGEYQVTTRLTFSIPGEQDKVIEDAKCAATVKTSTEPCPTNPSLPKDSPDCVPCPLPGKEHLPKDSPDCVDIPTVIPATGMGGILSGLMGTSAAGYGVTSLLQKRNLLKK